MRVKAIVKCSLIGAGIAAMLAILGSCGGRARVSGTDGMLEYAREYYDNNDIVLTDKTYRNEQTLAWFMSSTGFTTTCRVMSFRNAPGGSEYEFIADETAKEYAVDIWSCNWQNGMAVLVNNPECRSICIVSDENKMSMDITETPFDLYLPFDTSDASTRVFFYDQRGIRIT